jgi:hypothetical protein
MTFEELCWGGGGWTLGLQSGGGARAAAGEPEIHAEYRRMLCSPHATPRFCPWVFSFLTRYTAQPSPPPLACCRFEQPHVFSEEIMATPIIVGVGAIAAALTGRHLMKRGLLGGRAAAEQWVKGGFKAKMDRAEAVEILGLKCVATWSYCHHIVLTTLGLAGMDRP